MSCFFFRMVIPFKITWPQQANRVYPMRRSPSSPSNPLGSLPQAARWFSHPKNGEVFPVWSVLICGSMYVCMYVCMYVYIYTVYIYIYALYIYICVCISNYTVWFYLCKPLHLCILIHSYRIWKISWILAFFPMKIPAWGKCVEDVRVLSRSWGWYHGDMWRYNDAVMMIWWWYVEWYFDIMIIYVYIVM